MTKLMEAEQQIRSAVHRYCQSFDAGDFEDFAALFERGRWFAVATPGAAAVLDWIHDNVILYDGSPLTRHTVSNLIVELSEYDDQASFACYIDISQHLADQPPTTLAQARFVGTFVRHADGWSWQDHVMEPDYAGDLRTHIKNGLAAVGTDSSAGQK